MSNNYSGEPFWSPPSTFYKDKNFETTLTSLSSYLCFTFINSGSRVERT